MIDSIKGYLAAAGAIIVAIFVAVFKYRGSKIEDQKKIIDEQNRKYDAMEKYHESEKKQRSFEAQNDVADEKAKHIEKSNITDGVHRL
jgi:hypothetical protein